MIEEVIEKRLLEDKDIYIDALIAIINSKDTSILLPLLQTNYPLESFGLNHLKRARKVDQKEVKTQTNGQNINTTQILICPKTHESTITNNITKYFISTLIIKVCKLLPQTIDEYKQWGKTWQIQFRPTSKDIEVYNGITTEEYYKHIQWMKEVNKDSDRVIAHSSNSSSSSSTGNSNSFNESYVKHGAILVNPITQKVCFTIQ